MKKQLQYVLSLVLCIGLLFNSVLAYAVQERNVGDENKDATAELMGQNKEFWTEAANKEFAGGTGSSSDPFKIETPEQLAKLSKDSLNGNGFVGKFFKLINDIDLSGKDWTPIGGNVPFSGTFDGNCHIISNINVNGSSSELNARGLFANLDNAYVKNLGIAGSNYEAAGNIGHLAGNSKSSNIENCFAIGTITVNGNPGKVGGLIGHMTNGSVKNCYASSVINAPKDSQNVEGLIGHGEGELIVENSYYDKSLIKGNCRLGIGKSQNSMKSGAFAVALGQGSVKFTQNSNINSGFPFYEIGTQEPICKPPVDLKATENQALYNVKLINDENNTAGHWEWINSDERVKEEKPDYKAVFIPDDYKTYKTVIVDLPVRIAVLWLEYASESFEGGSGSLEDPYIIKTAQQLAKLSNDVLNNITYDGKYFKLVSDINLFGKYWAPIGMDSLHSFQGNFDGNHNIISGLYINSSNCPAYKELGLFGHIRGAEVYDLGLKDNYIYAEQGNLDYIGQIAGCIEEDAKIRNCFAEGEIESSASVKFAGGLTAYKDNSSEIKNSYSNSGINCPKAQKCGGVTAMGTVTNSYHNSDLFVGENTGMTASEMCTFAFAKLLSTDGTIWTQVPVENRGFPIFETGTDEPICIPPTGLKGIKGDKLSTLKLDNSKGNTSGRWEWVDENEIIMANKIKYKAVFIPDNYKKYKVTEVDVQIEIQKEFWTDGIEIDLSYNFNGGEGTIDNPYIISNQDDLAQLAVNVNAKVGDSSTEGSTYKDKYFVVENDISLKGHYWIPIGTFLFEGNIDGKNHIISDMNISADKLPSVSNFGLFGNYEGNYIKNLTLRNGIINIAPNGTNDLLDKGSAGIFAGSLKTSKGGAISNCSVEESEIEISADIYQVGGFAGTITNPENCRVIGGEINAHANTENLGGFAGSGSFSKNGNYVNGTNIVADTNAKQGNVGGFVGLHKAGNSSCYVIGTINVPDAENVAGISAMGENHAAECYPKYSYASVSITETTGNKYGVSSYSGEDVSISFYDSSKCPANTVISITGVLPKTEIELKSYKTARLLNNGDVNWTQINEINNGYPLFEVGTEEPNYKIPEGITCESGTKLKLVKLENLEGNTLGRWEWKDDEITVVHGIPTYTAYFIPNDYLKFKVAEVEIPIETESVWTDNPADNFQSGKGTKEEPWEINNAEQLAKLAHDVNSGISADGFEGSYFKLTADLDLSSKYWEPIGIKEKPFKGHFDGNNYTIKGIKIKSAIFPQYNATGLFGYIVYAGNETTSIENVIISQSIININSNTAEFVGSLIGKGENVSIKLCGVSGEIKSNVDVNYVGGIVGQTDGSINDCYFDGNVDVKSGTKHGGIAGDNSEVNNSYIAASINSSAGDLSPISNAKSKKNNYYNSDLYNNEGLSKEEGVFSKTTEEMKMLRFIVSINGDDSNAWVGDGAGYPVFSGGEIPLASTPANRTVLENTKLADIALDNPVENTEGTWLWIEPEQNVGTKRGDKTFPIMFIPKDNRYSVVRSEVVITVTKITNFDFADDPSTPEIEISLNNPLNGFLMGGVYDNSGKMLCSDAVKVIEDQPSAKINFGDYEIKEGDDIRIFLLDETYVPQLAMKTK